MKIGIHLGLTTFGLLGIAALVASAQDKGPPKAAPKTAPKAAQPAATPADFKAYSEALRITDPAKKIEALQKFLVDFPTSGGTFTVQRLLLQTLTQTYRDQKDKLLPEIDKLLAAAPAATKGTMLNTVASELAEAGVLLDEAADYAKQSIALQDEKKFIEAQKRIAQLRKAAPPSDDELKKRFRLTLATPQSTLGRVLLKQGKTAEAEALLKEAFAANPAIGVAAAALAELAEKKGDHAAAFDYLASVVLAGRPPAGTQGKLEGLFAKVHPNPASGETLDKLLDARYRKMFPTLEVTHYKATPDRSDRTVLAEVFTGSACPPCVAADLAFDAMLERYVRKDLVVLMYHLHIPGPDPMTNASTQARAKFYAVNSVPSYLLDGDKKTGGGSRDMAQGFYDRVNPTIEQRLETSSDAKLSLTASLEGTQAKVKAEASQIKGEPGDLKLQVALVEELLSYSGENGIRLHPVVVRSLGGESNGGFTIDAAKPAPVEFTFDLAKISDELKTYIDDYESKLPPTRKFSQKKHAIDPKNLAVVAFVQDGTSKKILQSAYVSLK